jgi:glycerol-3-phosphate acyltransferase PlsX
MKIGFDLMGSDNAPNSEFSALGLIKNEGIRDLVVCGLGDHEHEVADLGFEFQLADEVIGMHEIPSAAVRQKKNSSLGVLIHLLKQKRLDAVVSAGNTGAIMGFSMIQLGKIEGLSRPGLAITLPTEEGYSVILDVGANISPKAIDYYNYGLMGSVLAEIISDKKTPRIAILNIGTENVKGDETRQKAYTILQESGLNFIGNIEGNNIMKGFADVIITDGFTGNVVLKLTEGMIDTLWHMLTEEVDAVVRRRFGKYLVKPAVKGLRAKFNYEEHGGGILLGVDGVVIVCHGHSSPLALKNAVRLANSCVEFDILKAIKNKMKS